MWTATTWHRLAPRPKAAAADGSALRLVDNDIQQRHTSSAQRIYDIFEVRDGRPVWLRTIDGNEDALRITIEAAKNTTNESRIMHLASESTIAVLSRRRSAA